TGYTAVVVDGATTTQQQTATLNQINGMMADLERDTGGWVQTGVQIRARDGDSGLSRLTEAKVPLTWSSGSFGSSRINFSVTPITMNAGAADGTTSRRFGTGALSQSISAAVQTLQNERANGANVPNLSFNDLNPLTTAGLANLQNMQSILQNSTRKPNIDLVNVDSPGGQRASGAELNLALIGKNYKVDLGSTPLGQELNTLVGGVQWSPKLTDFLTLVVTGERRAVTDSLLSYVGAKDTLTGKHWGQVTKNGGNVLLSYDNGDVGFYGGGGAYSYLGENVKNNTGVMANAGAYIRPFHDRDRELKTGVSLSWMNFSQNLGYYSYGQGGYFSPQDYVSVSLPVEWSQKYDDLSVKAGVAVGYQSYSRDRSAYFPNNSDLQTLLESAESLGLAKESHYAGDSKSGIGYNVHVGADYRVTKDVTVGGQMGYDTFGNYNETTAQLYFRYGLGGK
ncbi:cellulose synthase subunit BcsC-related outer membrane protein, partial [Dickeya solani]|uniref:cellulose synthase subunit BcsC-related outer membrane protein n=1 Tax=Dickeya solani TaxID=1089444 RepID=UPI001380B1E0